MVDYTYSGKSDGCVEDGILRAHGHPTMDLNIPNGQTRTIQTRVCLSIPPNVVVSVRGLYEHRVKGIVVVERDIVGPCEVNPLQVVVSNRSDTTIRFEDGDPVAEIYAAPAQKRVGFRPLKQAEVA
jgi:dUTPase